MPYLACLPRLSATAQQFRRSTYLNPLESPLKNQHFALKTCQTIISESPAFECLPDNANTQGLSFQPIFIIWSQTGSSFSPAFVWLLCTFQRANHCLARPPALQAQPHIKTTNLPSIRIFLAFLASPYLNHTTLFTSVGATYLTFLPCIIPAISCIHSST